MKEFDAEEVMRGLGCLTKDAPLVSACRYYHENIVAPRITFLESEVTRLHDANQEKMHRILKLETSLQEIASFKGRAHYHPNQVESMAASNDAFEECAEIALEALKP